MTDTQKDINKIASNLKKEADKIEQLKELVDCDNLDNELIQSFLEGETETLEILDLAWQEMIERNILVVGLKSHISDMEDRKRRLENGAKKLKEVMCFVLKKTGQNSFVRPQYTASLKSTPKNLIIEDESAIPSNFFTAQPPTLNKKELTTALKNGNTIDGAILSENGFTIQIRNK